MPRWCTLVRMAGRPKTRAKLAAEAAAAAAQQGDIPDAVAQPPAQTYARAFPPRGFPAPVAAREPPVHRLGQRVRDASDHANATAFEKATQAMPAVQLVRITRTKPAWAAGFLEEYALEDGFSELLEYVRDEWGGAKYKLEMLLPDGAVGAVHSLAVAGPVRQYGKVQRREDWFGDETAPRNRVQNRNDDAGGAGGAGLIELCRLMMDQATRTSEQTMAAVRELASTSAKENRELIAAVVNQRENNDQRRGGSFSEQLGEILESAKALDGVKKQLAPAERRSKRDDDGDDDGEEGMMKEATKAVTAHFMNAVLPSVLPLGGPQKAAPRPPQQGGPRPPLRPVPNAHTVPQSDIPDAVQSGQASQRR